MKNFQLTTFLEINGICSASGLIYKDNSLFLISDNAGFLYEYDMNAAVLRTHSLLQNATENILKKNKPDFEAMTLKGNELHIFGSGSTEKRNRKFIFNNQTQQTSEENLAPLYQKIKTDFGISDDELNIEGALYYNKNLYLFQRGNGANSKNGIIKVNGDDNIQFYSLRLPKIKHVEATFTDAILVENKIYFLAAAEDTVSTYDDGEILGSMIGCMDIDTFHIDFTHEISNQHKFEGLTLYEISENEIKFLFCEDNDKEELISTIYKLNITIS